MPVSRIWAYYRKLYMMPYSYNGEVNRYFTENADNSDLDETKKLCLITATDSRQTAMIRQEVFYHRVLKTHLRTNDYRCPDADNGNIRYHPQVTMFFKEDTRATTDGNRPVTAEISFRLMNETTPTLTKANVTALATEIWNTFGGSTPYKFNKGKHYVYYLDEENGYDFRILVMSKTEGERVIKSVLSLRNHVFNEDYFRFSDSEKSNTTPPKTVTVLGRQRKLNRWRPNAIVSFMWADLYVHGLKPNEQPVLADCSGTKRNPIKGYGI